MTPHQAIGQHALDGRCTILRMESTAPPLYTITMNWLSDHGDGRVAVIRMPQHSDIGPHNHLFHELVMIDQGRVNHRTASGLQELLPGDLVLIRPGVWHAYESSDRLALTNCLIHPKLIRQILPWVRHVPPILRLIQPPPAGRSGDLPQVIRCGRPMRSRIGDLFQAMAYESHGWTNRHGSDDPLMPAMVVQLLSLLARVQQEPPLRPGISPAMHEAVHQTALWIQRHLTEDFDLRRVAEQTANHPAHLSRCFARQMGVGMVAYQHRLRIEQACRLLCLTPLSVTQIALRLGYNEVAYFSRRFKREMGVPPAAYRQAPFHHSNMARQDSPGKASYHFR